MVVVLVIILLLLVAAATVVCASLFEAAFCPFSEQTFQFRNEYIMEMFHHEWTINQVEVNKKRDEKLT